MADTTNSISRKNMKDPFRIAAKVVDFKPKIRRGTHAKLGFICTAGTVEDFVSFVGDEEQLSEGYLLSGGSSKCREVPNRQCRETGEEYR